MRKLLGFNDNHYIRKTKYVAVTLNFDYTKYRVKRSSVGSVYNFVSLLFCLIPEAGCGQSPQALINTGFPNISGK